MEELINKAIVTALNFGATYPAINTALLVLGGTVFILTVIKPFIFWAVKLTKTEKDDAVVTKIYGFIEATAIDFSPLVNLFKKKYPKTAAFEIKERTDE